jgi:uncharacterized membrane protein YoaK (UPF0700 family)
MNLPVNIWYNIGLLNSGKHLPLIHCSSTQNNYMLRQPKEERSLKQNILLASSTAFVAGVTNVISIIAFFAFTANVTGHVANLAKEIMEQDYSSIEVFVLWLLLFFIGALIASFAIKSFEGKSNYRANAIPIVIEIIVLLFVAIYGNNFYSGTENEREIITGCILFAMGLQNGMVSTASGGLIKSTHLTGLFTDLGTELADYYHPKTPQPVELRNKLIIRVTVLGFYIVGGVIGAYFYNKYHFVVFYFLPVILLTVLTYDLIPVIMHRITRIFSTNTKTNKATS